MAREIALSHHERWDGTGYPQALAGLAIPESARIVAVADVFDALSHDRVYRPAFPQNKVIEMLTEGSGTQFDPEILECFLTNLTLMEEISQQNPDDDDLTEPSSEEPEETATEVHVPETTILEHVSRGALA